MQKCKVVPVVLCGGSGKRLWPLSRHQMPKQFLNLSDSELSLFQQTLIRASNIENVEPPIAVANLDHKFLVEYQTQQCKVALQKVILEPVARNTSAAIASAALYINSIYSDALMLVLPSDHVILNPEAFLAAVHSALELAASGQLVTFGINPDKAETGYGYIQKAEKLSSTAYKVKRFVEKPNRETAEAYIQSGEFYWNSGIFLFKPSLVLSELAKFQPLVSENCKRAVATAKAEGLFLNLDKKHFSSAPSISIDYAVMEQTNFAAVTPVTCGWNDAGSWESIYNISDKSASGMARYGKGVDIDSTNCLIRAEGTPIYTIGVEDIVVVSTPDAVLVTKKDQSQKVQKLVDKLVLDEPSFANEHKYKIKPWGRYEIISEVAGSKVKKLFVQPKQALSFQYHLHRSENWIVTKGTAEAILEIDGIREMKILNVGDSLFIPKRALHMLSNHGDFELELIEIQLGEHLNEEDIIRISDLYGREDKFLQEAA